MSIKDSSTPGRLAGATNRARRAGVAAAAVGMLAAGMAGSTIGASPVGAASPNLFARVAADGTLLAGPNVTGVTAFGSARYEVTFTEDVSSCAFIATTENGSSEALQAYTASGHLSPNGVYVETKNQGGGLTDGAFDLAVVCTETGTEHAVVDYGGALARSSPGATLTPLGSGRYKVSFPTVVTKCAFLATVGDPGRDLVFDPSGVYTAKGAGAKSVLVETKNPGGGLQSGVPFHLAVICPDTNNGVVSVAGPDGFTSRGSKLTSTFRADNGNYVAVTAKDISACATVATRGSINGAVPFTPATVERTQGPAVNTVGIQVRSLLSFGGELLDEAFHTATVC